MLELKPSKIYCGLLMGAYALAVVLLLIFPLIWTWKIALLLAVAVNGWFSARNLKMVNRVKGIRYSNSPLELIWDDEVVILDSTAVAFFSVHLVILKLRWHGRNLSVPIFYDMCVADEFRRFRIWAKQALNSP